MEVKHTFGNIRVVRGYLHIDCRIYKERVRMTSGMEDTPSNQRDLAVFLNDVGAALKNKSFRFKEFFPDADQEMLDKFVAMERSLYGVPVVKPGDVTISEYADSWLEEEKQTIHASMKIDYTDLIESRIKPMIGHLTFAELTSSTLKMFVRNLKHISGKRQGQYLSAVRMRNILNLLRKMYQEACSDYKWPYADPFQPAFRRIKKIEALFDEDGDVRHKPREVWLLSEWLNFIMHVPIHYRPLFEAMRMGMIFSELKGLKKDCIHDDHIEIKRSYSRGVQKNRAKTTFRSRELRLGSNFNNIMQQAAESSQSEYVFTMEDGKTPLNYTTILKRIWGPALKAAGLPHRNMYSLRHTFVGWMVLLGVDSTRLKNLTGHSSRSTLTEDTYGDFREGLLAEKESILEHLGRDILDPEEFKRSFPHIYLQELGFDPTPATGMSPEAIKKLASMLATEMHEGQQLSHLQSAVVQPDFSKLNFGKADSYADANSQK
ncbi:integrase [Trichlorobacter thiogenes]|uniref:Integrase n=1 Tax=Trichlorobacter thiogenes TaxID=115783 RepID=A0A1T4N4G1_9BACT|nr:tyrosine-type recombinase/integrase [Trichlorobacter thiogenes]SJZ74112.1 integrase [Trichlorobacter thiogenes]